VGQIEIYELLKNKRLSGDDRFFTVPEIKKMLRSEGLVSNVRTGLQTAQLESFGYLEAKRISKRSDSWRAFRLKKSYL